MNCEQVPEAVSARIDGELDPAETGELDGHLAGCADCAREAAMLEETAGEMATLLQERAAGFAAPDDLARRVSGRPAPPNRMAPAVAIAAAVLVAFGVYLFMPQGDVDPPPTVAELVGEVDRLDASVSEVSSEWEEIKRDLHDVLLRAREKGMDVDLPEFLGES